MKLSAKQIYILITLAYGHKEQLKKQLHASGSLRTTTVTDIEESIGTMSRILSELRKEHNRMNHEEF